MWILSRIPRRLLVALAVPVGRIWYGLDRYHRKIAYDNMCIAFGREMRSAEIKRLVQANFVQLTRVAFEIPALFKLNSRNIDSYVEFDGLQNLRSALRKGKGIFFLTAHLGNWELMALAFTVKFNLSVNVIARPLDFSPMDRVLTEIRSHTGNRVIDKENSGGLIRQIMQEKGMVGILLDQNASWYEGVFVPLFGKIVCTNKGLAMLALRYDATVLPAFNYRLPDGRYRIIIDAPMVLAHTGNIGDDIVENTARFNAVMEKHIRIAPDNWLWVHRRFRMKGIPERALKKIKGVQLDQVIAEKSPGD